MCVFLAAQHFCFGNFEQSSSLIATEQKFDPLIPDLISVATVWWVSQHFKVVMCPAAIHLKAVMYVICCTLPHKSLTISCQTQLEKCGAIMTYSVKIAIRYLSSWQRTVSVVSTSTVRCQPLSKRETMCGTWSLLTQCLNDSSPETWRRWASSRDLVLGRSSCVQFK